MTDTPILSDRQREALQLVGKGLSTREIAVEMGCTERTAKFHVESLRTRFGVARKRDLVEIAHLSPFKQRKLLRKALV